MVTDPLADFLTILRNGSVAGLKKVKAVEPAILEKGWGYDRAVSAFMGGPGRQSFEAAAWVDATIVDGAVRGSGGLVQTVGAWVRRAQSGLVRTYAAIVGLGVVALLVWFYLRGVL